MAKLKLAVEPGRHFSNWLVAYMRFSQHSEAPDALHFWTAVSSIAGALRRRVWIDELHFQWSPNFYIIFVAPAGIATKSTTVNLGMNLLRRVNGVHFGPNSMTWQGLTMALSEAQEAIQHEDRILRMACLTIPVSELGTFLKTKDHELMALLTDLWDGELRPWKHRVKTGDNPETTIINPWMNIIGCTTPSWLRDNYSLGLVEGGLTSRCIFVFANSKRRLVPYPSQEVKSDAFYREQELLIEDLAQIGELCGEYKLTPDARKWGDAWYSKHWGPKPPADVGDRYSGYLARKQTHIHKLAMIIAASQRNQLVITHDDLAAAERFIVSIEGDMQRLFKRVGVADISRQTNDILEHIKSTNGGTYREVWRLFMPYMQQKDFDAALKSLVAAGHLVQMKNELQELCFLPFQGA